MPPSHRLLRMLLAVSLALNAISGIAFVSRTLDRCKCPAASLGAEDNSASSDGDATTALPAQDSHPIPCTPVDSVASDSAMTSSPPSIPPLFMARRPEKISVPKPFITRNLERNHKDGNATYSRAKTWTECHAQCAADAKNASSAKSAVDPSSIIIGCQFWMFNPTSSLCSRYPRNDAYNYYSINKYFLRRPKDLSQSSIMGVVHSNVTVWVHVNAPREVKNRVLMIVNWHYPASGEHVMRFMEYATARIPAHVDIVHSAPNLEFSLNNVWTSHGSLSYLGASMAYQAFPHYKGYLFTNDDVHIVWKNIPELESDVSWRCTYSPYMLSPGFQPGGNHYWREVFFNKSQTKAWKGFGAGWFQPIPPYGEDEFVNGDDRTFAALRALSPKADRLRFVVSGSDVFYISGADMPFASHWFNTMVSFGVHLETAVPTMMEYLISINGAKPIKTVYLQTNYEQAIECDYQRDKTDVHYSEVAIHHPCKLSVPARRRWLLQQQGFLEAFGRPFTLPSAEEAYVKSTPSGVPLKEWESISTKWGEVYKATCASKLQQC